MEKLLDSKTLADNLHMVPDTVQKMCKRGELPAIKIGRRWYVTEAAFSDYVNAKYQKEVS